MAFLKLYRKKLEENYTFLNNIFESRNIWGVVTKIFAEMKYTLEIIALGVREMHDSRISNLKKIKALDPTIQTVYIKPPAKRSIEKLCIMLM
jgi:predicted amino acid racemase